MFKRALSDKYTDKALGILNYFVIDYFTFIIFIAL